MIGPDARARPFARWPDAVIAWMLERRAFRWWWADLWLEQWHRSSDAARAVANEDSGPWPVSMPPWGRGN